MPYIKPISSKPIDVRLTDEQFKQYLDHIESFELKKFCIEYASNLHSVETSEDLITAAKAIMNYLNDS